MFSMHNVPDEGQFISPAKAAIGYTAKEMRFQCEYIVFPNKPEIRSARLCIESAMRMKGYGKTLLTWCTYKGEAEGRGAASGAGGGNWRREHNRDQLLQ